MRWSVLVLLCLASTTLLVAQESPVAAELRREGERASEACHPSLKSIPGCAYTLFTDHPFHIAAGSMPPQNGFGLGGAFALTRLLKTMLFGIGVTDALTFAAAPLGMMLVVLLATFVPALRATRISPVVALRYE